MVSPTIKTELTESFRLDIHGFKPKDLKSAPQYQRTHEPKKRIIPDENRKRGLYSCDRCKLRKTKCKRVEARASSTEILKYDDTTPCVQCSKAGVPCSTTIPRKKRVPEHHHLSNQENLGYHYKTLHAIMSHLYPYKDIDDINTIVELGELLGVNMPRLEDETPGARRTGELLSVERDDLGSQKLKLEKGPPGQEKYQSLMYDMDGNQHYIGPGGTGSVLRGLIDIIQTRSPHKRPASSAINFYNSSQTPLSTALTPRDPQLVFHQGYTPSPPGLDVLLLERFPLVNLLSRSEYEHYFQVFVDKVLPFYYIFRLQHIQDLFTRLMNELFDHNSGPVPLTNLQICVIYIIFLFARKFEEQPFPNSKFTMEVAEKYMQIIRLFLSDYIMTPSIGGIKLLFMVAAYLNTDPTRESAYILTNITYVQARSLGLHRESIILRFDTEEKKDDCRMLFWTIFKSCETMAVAFGRSSFIHCEDNEIDVSQPLFEYSALCKDESYKAFLKEELALGPLLNGILHNRKLLVDNSILSLVNIERNLAMTQKLLRFRESWPPTLLAYDQDFPIKRYKLKLHNVLQHHMSMVTLPFILETVNTNVRLSAEDPLFQILNSGISCAIRTSKVFWFAHRNELLNASVYHDRLYGYTATLVLVLTFILMTSYFKHHHNYDDVVDAIEFTPFELFQAIKRLKEGLESMHWSPTLARISVVTANLFGDLNIMEELQRLVDAGDPRGWKALPELQKNRQPVSPFTCATQEQTPNGIALPAPPLEAPGSSQINVPEHINFFGPSAEYPALVPTPVIDDELIDLLFGDNILTGTNSTSFNLGGLFNDYNYE
ncbi:hypothetical protein BABINDRAFT_11603 [Babjeviella inositovora NRRL Y-12698]|uniref:Zn(2)-C6 fungal-type domain-containing protein n=1 Tax=Babjeviella inositovora NRRL Y-12698 TaxID=984486 RepID=A0A1E3QWT4_9ASCO|nr:uncharacterized protein BABINDRAFT_11603 [Babjeviella inositovora NRRL Y-12698]ODQ81457.1 hypothetical protein BABINDRAFT_11603 [Babjeviella inositovora NRRL Y-12698]